MKKYFLYLSTFIKFSIHAPRFFKIITILSIAGIMNVIGFLLLMPVLDHMIFNQKELKLPSFLCNFSNTFGIYPDFNIFFSFTIFTIIGSFLLLAIGNIWSQYARFELIKNLRKEIITKHSLLSWNKATKIHSGLINDLMINQTEHTGSAYFNIYSFWVSFTQLFSFLLLGLIISYQLLLIVIVIYAFIALMSLQFQKTTRIYAKIYTNAYQNFGLFVADYNNNTKYYKISHFLHHIIERISSYAQTIENGLRKVYKIQSIQTFISQVLTLFTLLIVIYYYKNLHINESSLLVFLLVLQKMGSYIQGLFNSILTFQHYYTSVELLNKEISGFEQNQESNSNLKIDCIGNIIFNDVSFSYAENLPVLNHINCTIESQKTTMIIGKSGSGKSTLLDLISLLYHPTLGEILFNGIDGTRLNKCEFRKKIAYINQKMTLTHGTLRTNLDFENSCNDAELMTICEKVHLRETLQTLPQGFNTEVGENGTNFSGGQIQRIILARALLSKPEILILDEATSALDKQTEKIIYETIQELQGTLTIIIVTHNTSLTYLADKIIHLNSGSIHEEGII